MNRSLQTDPSRHWVKVAMRETVFAPDDTAPILVRSLIAAPFTPDTESMFNICVSPSAESHASSPPATRQTPLVPPPE